MTHKAKTAGEGRPQRSTFRLVLPLGGKPKVARVHHLDSPNLDASRAVSEFLEAALALRAQGLDSVLLAGAGFGGATLPVLTEAKIPTADEYKQCLKLAQQWLEAFSGKAQALGLHAVFGLDLFAASKRAPGEANAIAQFIVHYDPTVAKASLVAAKRLPTSAETKYLYCGEQPRGLPALMDLPGLGRTLPMVCHDLNVSNPRGIAAQSPGGEQAKRRRSIEKDLGSNGLETAFASIHSLWLSAPTFRTSMNTLEKVHRGVKAFAAFGTYIDSLASVIAIAERHTPAGLSTAELVPASWPRH